MARHKPYALDNSPNRRANKIMTNFAYRLFSRARPGAVIVLALWLPVFGWAQPAHAAGPLYAKLERAARALDAWQLETAISIATDVLIHNPSSDDARVLAAEVLHQRGQHEQALALLGEGRLAAQGADLVLNRAQMLHMPQRLGQFVPQLRGSAVYAATFLTRPTAHFRIRYQDKDVLMAHYADDVLEAAYSRIAAHLDAWVIEANEPITVEIYPDVSGLAAATGLTEQEIETSGTIAVCKFHRIMVISALATPTGYAWADTMAHELTHLMVSKRSHNTVPIWLHEGIAKYYESSWRAQPGENLSAYSKSALGKAVVARGLIPFARMHPSMAKLPNQHDAALAFAEVFSMVQMLVARRGPQVIAHALKQLGSGMPFDTVMQRTFGGTIGQLETALHKTLEHRRFKSVYGQAEPLRLGAQNAAPQSADSLASELPDGADNEAKKLLRLGELLQLRGHDAAALDPLERAYARVGAQVPKLGLRLAQALRAQAQHERAKEVAAATARQHSDQIEAHLLYAALLIDDHEAEKAAAPLRNYCLHNPFNPEAHFLWAQVLTAMNDAQGAQQERQLAALAASPRSVSHAPPKPAGEARMRVLTSPWGVAFIDDNPAAMATPVWDWPITAGAHLLRVEAQDAKSKRTAAHSFEAKAKDTTLLVHDFFDSKATP